MQKLSTSVAPFSSLMTTRKSRSAVFWWPTLVFTTWKTRVSLIIISAIKRKIDIEKIKAIIVSKIGTEFVVHVPSEYDYRYISNYLSDMPHQTGANRLFTTFWRPTERLRMTNSPFTTKTNWALSTMQLPKTKRKNKVPKKSRVITSCMMIWLMKNICKEKKRKDKWSEEPQRLFSQRKI